MAIFKTFTNVSRYDNSELNRVETNIDEVLDMANIFLSANLPITSITDRNTKYIDRTDSFTRISNNINDMNIEIGTTWTYKSLILDYGYPTSFSYQEANKWEFNLEFLYNHLTINLKYRKRCGTFNAGGADYVL